VHILSSPRLLWSVLWRHGPGKQGAEILEAIHRQLTDISGAANKTQIVFVERREGSVLVSVDDSVLPPLVASALGHWILETLQARGQTLRNSSAPAFNSSAPGAGASVTGRHLFAGVTKFAR
jgi:hypothetical protein